MNNELIKNLENVLKNVSIKEFKDMFVASMECIGIQSVFESDTDSWYEIHSDSKELFIACVYLKDGVNSNGDFEFRLGKNSIRLVANDITAIFIDKDGVVSYNRTATIDIVQAFDIFFKNFFGTIFK